MAVPESTLIALESRRAMLVAEKARRNVIRLSASSSVDLYAEALEQYNKACEAFLELKDVCSPESDHAIPLSINVEDHRALELRREKLRKTEQEMREKMKNIISERKGDTGITNLAAKREELESRKKDLINKRNTIEKSLKAEEEPLQPSYGQGSPIQENYLTRKQLEDRKKVLETKKRSLSEAVGASSTANIESAEDRKTELIERKRMLEAKLKILKDRQRKSLFVKR